MQGKALHKPKPQVVDSVLCYPLLEVSKSIKIRLNRAILESVQVNPALGDKGTW